MVGPRYYITAFIASISLLLFCVEAQARIKFYPTQASISPANYEQSFRFTNTGKFTAEFSFHVQPWGEGHTEISERQLIATPPVAVLKPGETQTIRLMMRGQKPQAPLFYRLNARSRPIDQEGRTIISEDHLTINLSLPIAYINKGATHELTYMMGRSGVTNVGGHYAKITGFYDRGGNKHKLLHYVLPQTQFTPPSQINGKPLNFPLQIILEGDVKGPVIYAPVGTGRTQLW